MSKFIDLTGQKFGRLTVLKRVNNHKYYKPHWLCKCDCKNEIIVCGNEIKRGRTKSCGCLRKEIIVKRSTKHGHSKREKMSKEYISWHNIKQRCYNPNNESYSNYGERGIIVCNRWLNSFKNFFEDMGRSPKGYQIDRIKNKKGYCKENCRWITPKQNSRNKRNNCLISFNGKFQCIAAWAEETGIPYYTLYQRIFKYGWSPKKALTSRQ